MGAQSDSKKVSISSANPVVISNVPPVSEPSSTLYLSVVISLLGAIGIGLVIGYFSPVIGQVAEITETTKRSWMSGVMPLFAMIGGIFAPFFVGRLGKKKSLIAFGVPFTLGWACFAFDNTFDLFGISHFLFFAGRMITGLTCGLVCGTAPGYVSEIATANKRGALGSCFQLFITLGILIASILGNLITYRPFAMLCSIPSILMAVFMFFMPESPVQIISQYPLNDDTISWAKSELRRLRSSDSTVDRELDQIVQTQKLLNDIPGESLGEKVRKADFYKPLVFSLFLMLVQQMSGVNAILFFANDIFASASMNLIMANAILNGVQSLATFGEMFIVEKLGRRILLVISGCGCSVGLGVMALFCLLSEKNATFKADYAYMPLITLVFFIISFSIGLAPIPWLMVPELTPVNNRATISGIAVATNWFIAFVVTFCFEPMKNAIHDYGAYFVFMLHTVIGVAILLIFLPETGGRDIENIRRKYSSGWRNSLFVATASRRDSIAVEALKTNENTAQGMSNA